MSAELHRISLSPKEEVLKSDDALPLGSGHFWSEMVRLSHDTTGELTESHTPDSFQEFIDFFYRSLPAIKITMNVGSEIKEGLCFAVNDEIFVRFDDGSIAYFQFNNLVTCRRLTFAERFIFQSPSREDIEDVLDDVPRRRR